jgi:JmjC domain
MTVRANLTEHFAELQRFVKGLKGELELPSYTAVRSLVYCSPRGEGTSLHFDKNSNVVVQLAGEKQWTLAPNAFVENPTERYTPHMRTVPPLLADYVAVLPCDPSEVTRAGTLSVEMRPGDVLFVPRGFWHATSCAEESLQVNFTADSPTWAALVAAALQRRLERLPEWRELPWGLESKVDGRRQRAVDQLRGLLGQVSTLLGGLDAAELPRDAEWRLNHGSLRKQPTFQRSERTRLELRGRVLWVTEDTEETTELDLEHELVPLARYVCETDAHFTEDQASLVCPALDAANVRRFLMILVRHRALQRLA